MKPPKQFWHPVYAFGGPSVTINGLQMGLQNPDTLSYLFDPNGVQNGKSELPDAQSGPIDNPYASPDAPSGTPDAPSEAPDAQVGILRH